MCEFSGRLVAWMDHELEQEEAAAVEQHLGACADCRNCVAELERVSRDFNAYCEALAQSKGSGKAVRVERVLWAAAAAAIMLAAFVVYPRHNVVPPAQQANATAAIGKLSPDTTPNASVRATPDEVKAGPAAMRQARGNTRRAHVDAVLANRSGACCRIKDVKSASADSPAAAPFVAAQSSNWIADEPSVQIAISAAAMFPPGAVPDGIDFVADLSIGADGSVRQVRLQPQVSEFERRSSQR